MEPEQTTETQEVEEKSSFNKVTPLSKYLAMALFILMPFIGGWIGYKYAPEKVVEIEKIVIREVEKTPALEMEQESDPLLHVEEEYFVVGDDVYWFSQTEDSFFSAEPEYVLLKLPEADPDTFEPKIVNQFDVSQGNTFQGWISRDKDHVYYRDEIIIDADPATFRVGENVSVNFDGDHVFLWHEIIPEADPDTYEIILDTSAAARGTVHGKDANNCYIDYEIVSCDGEPFSS